LIIIRAAPFVTHIMLRPISSGLSFLATIIHDDRNVPTFSYCQSLTLIESAPGDIGHINGVTIMPLAPNSWLTGFLHTLHGTSGIAANRMAIQVSGAGSDSESNARTLRGKTTTVGVIPSIDDNSSSGDDNSVSDSNVNPNHNNVYPWVAQNPLCRKI